MLALKIDVDTHDGMAVGVPRLLDRLAAHGVRGTFFLSMGPDRSGMAILQAFRSPRFVQKMLTTGAPSLYGWRTMLSGTLLPARPIATAFPEIVRRIEDQGHETAIHAWDHRAWQDDLPNFKTTRIRAHYDRALAAYRALTGHDPQGCGAPAWMTTPASLGIQDSYPFTYASDLRASPPCRLATPLGPLRLMQLPGTGPCLEELMIELGTDEDRLLTALEHGVLDQPGPLRVLTLHAEVEGGPYLALFDRLLHRIAGRGPVVTMAEAARKIGPLPLRNWCMRRLPGRAFPVSSSTACPV